MLKRTMKNTFPDKGESYIPVCVLVLFLSALVSVLILYIGTMAQVQAQKRDVKTKLDSVVSEYATEMFDAIKDCQRDKRDDNHRNRSCFLVHKAPFT